MDNAIDAFGLATPAPAPAPAPEGRKDTSLAGSIDESTVVLSILAGTPLRTLSSNLNVRRTVRSMPNTPAAVKEGITVWMGTPELSESDRRLVAKVLGAFGEEVMVDDEKYLDMATAISGSGPAYVQPHGRK